MSELEEMELAEAMLEERDLDVIETEILWYKQQAGTAILEIGARLIEAKRQLGHGEWIAWLRDKVDFSDRSAQNFMRLAKEYRNPQTVADLGASKALALLDLPESERDGFLSESHTVNWAEKTVSEMSKRELEQAIRERDKARLAAEAAQAERQAAETARAKMEADMLLAKHRLDDLDRQAQAAEARADHLRSELEELKSRPVEVAVQVDESAVARARAEGEKAGSEAREKELAEIRERLTAAEHAKRSADAQVREAREQLEALRADLKESGKSSAASDPDVVEFGAYLNGMQDQGNRALGPLTRMVSAGKTEQARKLGNAMQAMAEKVAEAVRRVTGG